jgi:hypothetical protein
MIAIALGQMLMSFNVASLPVALSGKVKSFNVAPTTVATGIVMYSMAVAGFVMLGAKLNQRFGALHVFRAVIGCWSRICFLAAERFWWCGGDRFGRCRLRRCQPHRGRG